MYHEIIILQSAFDIAGVLQNDRAEHLYELIDAGKVESTYDYDIASGQREDGRWMAPMMADCCSLRAPSTSLHHQTCM